MVCRNSETESIGLDQERLGNHVSPLTLCRALLLEYQRVINGGRIAIPANNKVVPADK